MLLRKRAWDIMNEEFSTIDDSASLAEAVRTLRDSMKEMPDNHIVVVKKKNGSLRGVVSIWTLLKAVEDMVLKDEDLTLTEEADWTGHSNAPEQPAARRPLTITLKKTWSSLSLPTPCWWYLKSSVKRKELGHWYRKAATSSAWCCSVMFIAKLPAIWSSSFNASGWTLQKLLVWLRH